jgi:bifunctional non-homologous end joining protein LigD
VHELKLDGYRIQAHLDGGKTKLFSRNGLDWTARMRGVAAALQHLPAQAAVLDGEVVVLNEHGLSDFAKLQSAFDEHKPTDLTYFCFDLLHLDGHNLRAAGVVERKELLRQLLQNAESEALRFSEHLEADGQKMFSEACRLGAEGIVSKRKDAKYTSGRSPAWTKTKCILQQEFVVGGYTHPAKGGEGLGALLLGYYHGGVLKYCGRAGTGFTQKSARALRNQLEELKQKAMPFAEVATAARKDALWVKPQLVAEIEFRAWTSDGMLRQAAFKGLREDKSAREVQREHATPESKQSANNKVADRRAPDSKKPQAKQYPPAVIRLTHADKIIDADSGLTKQMLANYYSAVAEKMLPHIADRPLSIVRCPDGSTSKCFFQKHMKVGLPKGTGSVDVPDKKTGKVEEYITLSSKEALVGMAQMNVLELHPWGSRNEHLEEPDRIIFDLDPDEALPWSVLAESADEVRKRLLHLDLKSFLKGTGGKGLHVVVPIVPDPAHDWSVVKAFAHAFVQRMETDKPKLYLTKMTKSARTGKIYLDYLRNERGATAVAAYSPRNRSGVPVSVPLSWKTLEDNAMPRFKVADFPEWLDHGQGAWKALPTLHQNLSKSALDALGIRQS